MMITNKCILFYVCLYIISIIYIYHIFKEHWVFDNLGL